MLLPLNLCPLEMLNSLFTIRFSVHQRSFLSLYPLSLVVGHRRCHQVYHKPIVKLVSCLSFPVVSPAIDVTTDVRDGCTIMVWRASLSEGSAPLLMVTGGCYALRGALFQCFPLLNQPPLLSCWPPCLPASCLFSLFSSLLLLGSSGV